MDNDVRISFQVIRDLLIDDLDAIEDLITIGRALGLSDEVSGLKELLLTEDNEDSDLDEDSDEDSDDDTLEDPEDPANPIKEDEE